VRTVDDLRAALESLEAVAPDPDQVLAKVSTGFVGDERHARRRFAPTVAVALTVTCVLAVVGLAALLSGSARTPSARHTSNQAAAGNHGRPLPFRLTGSLGGHLAALDIHSDIDPARASGNAVLAEYGMELTIAVATGSNGSTHTASATPTLIHGQPGWIDISCPVRPAPPSAAQTTNLTCSLSYDSGPWNIAIYVAGPGGGSQKITPQLFLELADHLQLATSPSDPSTWFESNSLLPR
jgi:hypothetical protein